MLTEKERKWLEFRKDVCFRCKKRRQTCSLQLRDDCRKAGYPIRDLAMVIPPDYRDAAEFEARVAVVAANGAQPCLQYDYNCPYGYAGDCPDNCDGNYNRFGTQATRCGLKHARLYVEEEMDNERNHS